MHRGIEMVGFALPSKGVIITDFGFLTVATEHTIPPKRLGPLAEANGFESIFFGEHTHIPVRTEIPDSPYFPGGVLPDFYYQFYDPFIAMAERPP